VEEIASINEEMGKETPAFSPKELAEMYDVQVGAIYYQYNKFRNRPYRYDTQYKEENSTPAKEEVAGITVAPSIPADTIENDTHAALIFTKNEYIGVAMEAEKLSIQMRNHIEAIDAVIEELEHQQLLDRAEAHITSLERKLVVSTNALDLYKAEAERSRKELLAYKNRTILSD